MEEKAILKTADRSQKLPCKCSCQFERLSSGHGIVSSADKSWKQIIGKHRSKLGGGDPLSTNFWGCFLWRQLRQICITFSEMPIFMITTPPSPIFKGRRNHIWFSQSGWQVPYTLLIQLYQWFWRSGLFQLRASIVSCPGLSPDPKIFLLTHRCLRQGWVKSRPPMSCTTPSPRCWSAPGTQTKSMLKLAKKEIYHE